ncbi:UNKNOWN [Stylonychia lemnae]|uniref:Uncharacterized protein n=1 Tax=Stylonychia lemnae TaxID=5949 RepID=A0A078AJY0_STYLE|nr:UNKNOWN [Stylonychia lemnae]|eukprot:CDW82479.1 UNKNOWN [Stylonychia lemnae]
MSNIKVKSNNERVEDMHLMLSEKYMTYKDLADRCLINTQQIDKGDKRVFYLKPQSVFLEEPRKQNQFRNDFVKMVQNPPAPEPFTLFADDLHRDYITQIQDKSNPYLTKIELANFYKRRQYKLQHKKYKLMQRWAHHALTSELVDKVSLKFSPIYSKLQFELENSVKRYSRLEGEDHFLNTNRPQTSAEKPRDDQDEKMVMLHYYLITQQTPLSTLRLDDLDVYLRIVTYEEKINKDAEKFIQRVKWTPMSNRYEIFQESIEYFQKIKAENIEKQRVYTKQIEHKGQALIQFRKLGVQGQKELHHILQSQYATKLDKRNQNLRDKYINTCKYNYESPNLIVWNDLELKSQLSSRSAVYGIHGDLEIDSGHSFAYSIMVFFPTYFHSQVIKSQFAIYDAVPALIDPTSLAQKNIQSVLNSNRRKYGNTVTGRNTLLEKLEIKQKEEQLHTEFINSVEKALFGEFNSGQIKDFPSVRMKKSLWVLYVCYQPTINNDQKYQAAILAGEQNPIDECLRLSLDLINVQDVTNVNLILESLSTIHHDKLIHGDIKADFLLQNAFVKEQDRVDKIDEAHVFTEGEVSFLSIFKGCLKTKSEYEDISDPEPLQNTSILQVPQHLLFSLYMLKYIKARDSKIKLLYVLNAFRAIQKRMVIELREMGTRDRVMGDVMFVSPMEQGKDQFGQDEKAEDLSQQKNSVSSENLESQASKVIKPEKSKLLNKVNDQNATDKDEVDIINDHLVDIQKVKFNGRFQNYIYSTCPIIPRFHSTFGEPLDRQEISAEVENHKKADNKKEEGLRLLGRVDDIYYDEKADFYFVKDDFGIHIMFDASFLDMKNLEQEVLKICSFYIQKREPLLDHDLRYIYPSVDRFEILDDVFECELAFQRAKLELALTYLECFEHTTDTLEQQRMVQVIIDLMALRPKLNLNGLHFKDSYRAEIENFQLQKQLIREVIRMQMESEFKQNNFIREYLERTYRVIMEMVENKFQYQRPETLDQEIRARENLQKGIVEEHQPSETMAQDSIQTQDTMKESQQRRSSVENLTDQKTQVFSAKFSDPREFANYLGIPFASLQMLMKDYKERDPLVKQSIHEHVSFIKIEEGYPIFMYDMATKQNNTLSFTKDSQRIGILDFYESMHMIVKVVAAMQGAFQELNEIHRPDNGLMTTALEISTYRYFLAELKVVKGERTLSIDPPLGMNYIEDDSILGNSDKMLFYTKEFVAAAEDELTSHNPYILTKMNLKTIENFQFENFQKLIIENQVAAANGSLFQESQNKGRKITTHHAYRFYPKLKTRAQKVFIPSMLYLTCNSIEMLRLRHILVLAVTQKKILERVYERQVKLFSKDGRIYFKDQFNFENFIELSEKNYINFVDEGPSSGIEMDLAINEFDPTLRSQINFSDPDSFKQMICPLGLEELRTVVSYELMNLQALIVATQTNQILLDNSQRYLTELELFAKGVVVANPVFDYFIKLSGSNLLEQNLKKLHVGERSMVLAKISSRIGEVFFNIIARKNRNRNAVEKHFQKYRIEISPSQEKHEIQFRKLRTFRLSLCQDYCTDVLADVYGDAIKLQLLLDCDQIRKRAYLLPKESLFIEIGPGEYGEFQCVNYQQENQNQGIKQLKFLDKSKRKIKKYWKLPSNKEILRLPSTYDQVRQLDLKHLYQFDIDLTSVNKKKLIPNFKKNNQHKILQQRLTKMIHYESKDLENIYKEKQRFVEFQNSYSYQYHPNYTTNYQNGQQISPHLQSIVKYFKSLQNLLDLELFQNKIASNAQTLASLERNVLCGLPFWEEGDDALFDNSNQNNEEDEDIGSPKRDKDLNQKKSNVVQNIGYKNELSKYVVERIAAEKKNKLTLHQELESVKDKFNEMELMMNKLELNDDIEKAAEYLNDQAHLSYYGLVSSFSAVQDFYLKETDFNAKKELLSINELLKNLSHVDDIKVTYTNGYHVNTALTKTQFLNLDENCTNPDFTQWARSSQPIIDENALAPSQFTLIDQMFGQNCNILHSFKKSKTYMGKIHGRDYQYMDYSMINVDKSVRKYVYNNLISVDNQLKEYLKIKFNHDDTTFIGNLNQYFDLLFEKKQYLKTLLKSRQLRRIVMILLGNKPLPIDLDENQRLQQVFQEDVQWKINTRWDEYQINKIKRQEQEQQRRNQQQKQSIDANTINQSLRKQDQMVSNVLTQLELSQVEIEILSNEVQRFLISASYKMLDMETSALCRAFEVNGKLLEFYVHPCQQFASTRDQKVDKRNHLDIINKVSFAQRFLTQIKNRCLEIETITSGLGMVISQKDLNECLDEACRAIVKQGEVEMRTRCETFAMQQIQYENMIYIKDRQLLNMEEKLKHAKRELDKIIRTKVFSKGNQLVYELDTCTRQLRMIKDNIYEMEKKLSDKIRLEFDRELNQRTLELDECKRKFADFQMNVNARVMADVRENVNNIDTLMKNKADMFKDLSKNTSVNQSLNSTTININNLTIKNITTSNSLSADIISQGDNNYFQRMMREYEVLKQSEGEARHEIVKLQEVIRKMRIFDRFKTVLMKQQYENKLDNLRDQLNSNTLLWEQLAEGEKREKILKKELEQSQQEIVTQEKIIEQLKDELKRERGEKQKLIQYKQTKSKRLDELESKAREFEVLQNLNLPKVLNLLEAKEEKIHELKSKEKVQEAQFIQLERVKALEMTHFKKKYENEVKMKSEAISKLETLRHELFLIEGQDQTAIDVWKDKCKNLIEICKSFKEENDRLLLQTQYQTRFQPSQIDTSRREETNESYFDNEVTESSRNNNYDKIGAQNLGIGSSYQKKQAQVIDKRNPTTIKEDEKEEHEYTNTQNSVKSSIIATTSKIEYSRNSGNNSSRFKLKKDFSSNNKQSTIVQQQVVNELNSSLENPYYTAQQVNLSVVLAGSNGAFTGTQFQNNAMEKANQSFIESSRRDPQFDVAYNKRKQQYMSQNRGNNSFNERDRIAKMAGVSNIFQNKQRRGNELGEEYSPPKTPNKLNFEFESHTSSIYGKLTPVYDPKLAQSNQVKKTYSIHKQKQQEKSENVFSSLNNGGNQINFNSKNFQGIQLMQTSQENLNDIKIESKDVFSRNLQIKGTTQQNYLQQKLGLSSNPNLISGSQLQTQITNPSQIHNQSFVQNQVNNRVHNISNITQDGATTLSQSEQKDQRQQYSNSVIKPKVVPPPRALSKDLERSGFKGQVIRKTSQQQVNE